MSNSSRSTFSLIEGQRREVSVKRKLLSACHVTFTILLLFSSASRVIAQTSAAENRATKNLALLKRAVVIVTTFDRQGKPLLQGSGFFIKTDCIVTNLHVIKDANQIRITTFGGRTSTVQNVLASDEKDDLALLKVESSLTNAILQLEDNTPVEGDTIVVVSNPQGSPWKITRGHVGLLWEFGGTSSRIQISASILPGSSGGPVVNEQGRVIGVAAMHFNSVEDLNFAVPAESLKALQASTNVVARASRP